MLTIGTLWFYAKPEGSRLPKTESPSVTSSPVISRIDSSSSAASEPNISRSISTSAATAPSGKPPLVALAVTHSLGTPSATPAVVTVHMPTTVTVMIQISDPLVIASSVNLLRLGPPGTQPTILGVMQNTSAGMYSLQYVFAEPTTGQLLLQVSAAFTGSLLRVKASVPAIPIVEPLSFTSGSMALTLEYPADWYMSEQGTSSAIFSNVQDPSTVPSSGYFAVDFLPQANPGQLSISQWFARFSQIAPFPPISSSSVLISGRTGIVVTVPERGADTMIFVPRDTDILQITYDSEALQFVGDYTAMLNSMSF